MPAAVEAALRKLGREMAATAGCGLAERGINFDELADWAPRVRDLAAGATDTHVLFNNCYANYGATNALELSQLLLDLEAAGSS